MVTVLVMCMFGQAAVQPKERTGIDPYFQGTWLIQAQSADGGKTLIKEAKLIAQEEKLCTVSSMQVVMGDKALKVRKVLTTRNEAGYPCNVIKLEDNSVLVVTKRMGAKFAIVQKLEDDGKELNETMRWQITISKTK